MATKYQWIDNEDALAELCEGIVDGDVVAIDTESDHFFAYRPYVALIQVATPARAALVDPLALSADALDPLLAVVEDPRVTKIMHSARNDISELDRDWGIDAQNVFDTQLAARFLGYERFSLNALLQHTAGISLNKKYQRFNWARRPIPPEACEYAVQDVVHLFDLRSRLLRELEAEGWMRAFDEHSAVLVAESGYQHNPFDPEGWRDLKGAKTLDDVGRAVCAALFVYRHELCDRLDRAPLHVLENHAVVEIARTRPNDLAALSKIRGIAKRTLEREGAAILDVVRVARDAPAPPAKRQRSRDERGRRLSQAQRRVLKDLLATRQELGQQMRLDLDFVASRGALEAIAALGPRHVDDLAQIEELLGWQREFFGAQLVAVCR